ncbi:CHAP domain-containing protein [Pedobacter metabolipauper]|uniref:CHAP domain-containing protein n=1 Tax=Pedobacter metabolipauper TaxID=425513 RepID=A0A4V3D1B5_9SPHI|nr:CHAP domain-containing protein [Pedobacter metabolipauper]TDQ10037.1 CHAP domain-containing protein [Pedobacter metabolipauper]
MASVRFFLVIICFVVAGAGNVPGSNLLGVATAELGVHEVGGNNAGARVETYLAAVGLKKPEPWCAAFVSWVFKQCGYAKPRTGWSPALFPDRLVVKKPVPGCVFGIYFPELKRIGHCGFVTQVKGDWIGTIEGNTNVSGGREGDGVYRRTRHVRTICKVADYSKSDNL